MSSPPRERRALPVLNNDTGRAIGAAGVVICTLCCLSIPGIAAALAAVGLSFLRNDRILFPGTVLFAALVIVTFVRSRARHRRWAPLGLALAAVAVTLVGLRSPGSRATVLVTIGVVGLLAVIVWDGRLERRCGK